MKASIQNLIKEFRAVIFEKDDLEFRDMSQVKAVLALMANHDSTSDAEFRKQTKKYLETNSPLQLEIYRLTP